MAVKKLGSIAGISQYGEMESTGSKLIFQEGIDCKHVLIKK